METPKLRIVFYEDERKGKKEVLSYYHLEKSEALRVIKILKILPDLKEWTPASVVAEMIDSRLPATLWTLQKLAGALRVDIKTLDGVKTVASRPVLFVRKRQFNTRNNLNRQKYLRAGVSVKSISQK